MKKYWINGADIFGLDLECKEDCGPNDVASDIMETDDPKKAIEMWFRVGQKFPSCTDLMTKTKADACVLLREATPEYLTELYSQYKCPYKLEYLISSVQQGLSRGGGDFYASEFGDSIYPFCCG
jgi:hypothetical protein